ncbi:MAG: formylglycine-generating enzyme family protein [Dehalococcoidia bacterium]
MKDIMKPTAKISSKFPLIGGIVVLIVVAFLAGRYSTEFSGKTRPANVPKAGRLTTNAQVSRHTVLVPAGEFVMGTDKTTEQPIPASYGLRKPPYENEQPRRTVFLDAFYIDRFEVSNIEYKQFVDATQARQPDYWKDLDLKQWGRYPIMSVSWFEADSYCKWKGQRLPTEAEWEKAARGAEGRRFPWGNEYDKNKANTQQQGLAPIGFFPEDVSPYGVHDMGGNIAEWVDSWYTPYPGNEADDPDFGEKYRVIRGGSWGGVGHYNLSYYVRTAYRAFGNPAKGYNDIGFRCAMSAKSDMR